MLVAIGPTLLVPKPDGVPDLVYHHVTVFTPVADGQRRPATNTANLAPTAEYVREGSAENGMRMSGMTTTTKMRTVSTT